MKKIIQYISLFLLIFSNVPVQVQAVSKDDGVIQEVDTSDFSIVEATNDEPKEEQSVPSEQIDNEHELQESSDQDSEIDHSRTDKSLQLERSSDNQLDQEEDLPEESSEDTQSFDSRNFINSKIVNGVKYEWNWDSETKSLDFNANDGNSQDAIQVMQDSNLIDVQHLILRNLNQVTQLFQSLSSLVTIEFYNVAILGNDSFRGIMNLREVTFTDAISVQERVFQDCQNLIKVNNSIAMNAILANAFNGTSIEEIEVGTSWHSGNASQLSLNGMDFLKKLVNHGGGGANTSFLGATLPALEIYEGYGNGGAMFSGLVNFLNLRAPNLRIIKLISNMTSSTYRWDQLHLSKVTYLEEFTYMNSSTSTIDFYRIESNTFEGLNYLRTVQIDQVQEIGANVFNDLPKLEEVHLNHVTTIDDVAVARTPSLKKFSAPRLKSMGNSVFMRSGIEEIYFPNLETGGNYLFERNDNLKRLDLPKLRTVGWQLVSYCPSLEEINLPRLETITHASFLGTPRLETINLPAATSISGVQNFVNSGVKNLILPQLNITNGSADQLLNTSIDYLEVGAATNAARLFEIFSVPRSVRVLQINEQTVFGENFADLSNSINTIEKIVLPNTTHLGNNMFRNMTSLKEIEAPKLTEIGDRTFENSGVISIDFPELRTAGVSAFAEMNKLLSVTLNKLDTLSASAFYRSRVEKVVLPEVSKLPESVFEKCTRLTEVIMPKVEAIGINAFSDTKSLKELKTPEVREVSAYAFSGSGIEYLDFPKLTLLGVGVFQWTENLKYLNIPAIKKIHEIDGMFNETTLAFGIDIHRPNIHDVDTSVRNQSGIEMIMTLDENREVVHPLTEDKYDRILAIATDGTEVIESESVINLEVGEQVNIPVRSNLIINDSIDDVKADVDHVWMHDGNRMERGDSLVIEEIMPWHNGIYQRHLAVNYSQTEEEIFSYDSNTVTLIVHYTDELGVTVSVEDTEITIGDSTTVTATIENISGYGEVEVSIDLVNGLLDGIELVENSISSVMSGGNVLNNIDLSESVTIPQNGKLEITYEVLGVNNESIENNLQVILTEVGSEEEAHVWSGKNRLIVSNGRIRFASRAPETIEFSEWDSSNSLMLGNITSQSNLFKLDVEDLRGTNMNAQNEIMGNRSNWSVEVGTDNVFVDERGQESLGLLQLLAQTEDGNWHDAKIGVPMYTHVVKEEIPLSLRYHSVDIGDGTQLGIMLNQLTGLIENSTYSVDMTFDLVIAP
ncbi:hypothetical protein FG877_10545 [Enterococcus casseliflavus]|nr:hypothetical protein [Enterococcus casseliflavus]